MEDRTYEEKRTAIKKKYNHPFPVNVVHELEALALAEGERRALEKYDLPCGEHRDESVKQERERIAEALRKYYGSELGEIQEVLFIIHAWLDEIKKEERKLERERIAKEVKRNSFDVDTFGNGRKYKMVYLDMALQLIHAKGGGK